jgi:hypothetical protein
MLTGPEVYGLVDFLNVCCKRDFKTAKGETQLGMQNGEPMPARVRPG